MIKTIGKNIAFLYIKLDISDSDHFDWLQLGCDHNSPLYSSAGVITTTHYSKVLEIIELIIN